MNIKIKLFDGAKAPEYKTKGAACADCYANEDIDILLRETKLVKLGFALELPEGYEAQIRGRSGLAKNSINSPLGTIDCDYRGEVCAIITNNSERIFRIHKGDRIAQMKIGIAPQYVFEVVDKLSTTERNNGGFGSTGV